MKLVWGTLHYSLEGPWSYTKSFGEAKQMCIRKTSAVCCSAFVASLGSLKAAAVESNQRISYRFYCFHASTSIYCAIDIDWLEEGEALTPGLLLNQTKFFVMIRDRSMHLSCVIFVLISLVVKVLRWDSHNLSTLNCRPYVGLVTKRIRINYGNTLWITWVRQNLLWKVGVVIV